MVSRKIYHSLAKAIYTVLPTALLLRMLRFFHGRGKLGSRIISGFNPNEIRKTVGFKEKQKILKISDADWVLNVNVSDFIGFRSFITDEPFEMAVFHLANKLAPSGRNIIIDIGANIGSASIPICAINNFELVAVEASKENAALLMTNILENNVKAKVYPFALVDRDTGDYLELFINDGNTGANSLLESWSPGMVKGRRKVELVPSKTLDSMIVDSAVEIGKILLVKIDVEGMEKEILEGGKSFLASNDAPIIFEYRADVIQDEAGKNLARLVEIFESNDYEIRSIQEKDWSIAPFDPGNSYANALAVKKNSSLANLLMVDEKL